MSAPRWHQLEQLYSDAIRREGADRQAFLDRLDPGVRREVEALLSRGEGEAAAAGVSTLAIPIEEAMVPGRERLGSYEVIGPLGKGGMGEVFRARDPRLGRDIAIKTLPARFAAQAEWLARFRREARLLASLNHPNVAVVYGLEEWDGRHYLLMELVEGETLAERLKRGPVVVDEALRLGLQIAEALEAAHAKGITHRDIKPANVKVTPEGRVKVLDFGLAKLDTLAAQNELAPTLTMMTEAGVAMGTPAYMSPEQVRAEVVDHRTDIWAWGCLMFELLTGSRAFRGGTTADLIAAVLTAEPDWNALPALPAEAKELLIRCLKKDSRQRTPDIASARKMLESSAGPKVHEEARIISPVSLAVLPFANASGDPEMEYLSDGLTESIMFSLSQSGQIRLMSRSAVFRHKESEQEPHIIGRQLGVSAVVTGRVQQRGPMLIVSSELVDTASGFQLWGAQYRKRVEDIFALEEQLAAEISERLRSQLAPTKVGEPPRRQTENVEAYHLYLRGMHQWGKRTEEGLKRAIQYFRQAIEVDPTYAKAHAGVAMAYTPLAMYGHLAPKDAIQMSRAAAQHALAIDPGLPEARTLLAGSFAYFEGDLRRGQEGRPRGGGRNSISSLSIPSVMPIGVRSQNSNRS